MKEAQREMEDEARCMLCQEKIGEKAAVIVAERGCETINRLSSERGDNICIPVGAKVHKLCRSNFLLNRSDTSSSTLKRKASDQIILRSKRTFNYQTDCILCGEEVQCTTKAKITPSKSFYKVRTKAFQESIKERCIQRNDDWSKVVLSRIEYSQDLIASDTLYHQQCSVLFRCERGNCPEKIEQTSQKRTKVGRKVCVLKEDAFAEVIKFIECNESTPLTISELVERMKQNLDENTEPFSNKHMKRRLAEHFGENLLISDFDGKSTLVTLKVGASKLIDSYYQEMKNEDEKTKKEKVIELAAKLILKDIQQMQFSTDMYPSCDDIESGEKCMEYLPESLQTLLVVVSGTSSHLKKAAIGQAIMQACRPKQIAPLQINLAIQLHTMFGSKILIETLHALGFCSSYWEVQRYEKSASVDQPFEIPDSTNERCIQFMADNIDHNLRTIDGLNTFHGMGMMATITPGTKVARRIPRIHVSAVDVADVGKVEIKFRNVSNVLEMKYGVLPLTVAHDETYNVDVLWKMSWLLRPTTPLWNGTMQMVHKGSHPGQSTAMFLPMIDMDPSNETCIYSTLSYISSIASKYNVDPIITFDQPLWWKATMIVASEPATSAVKGIVLRLGGLHIKMSFLGSIGYLMTDSGLKELLETVYAADTVPHMLSGKAIARALRGHLLAEMSLCTLIASNIFDTEIEIESPNKMPSDSEPQDEYTAMIHYEVESCSAIETKNCNKQQNTNQSEQAHCLSEAMDVLDKLLCNEVDLNQAVQSSEVQKAVKIFNSSLSQMKGRTAQLWCQYIEMLDILKCFIKAERTGNWNLHLQSLLDMLPYFAATGHNPYTKSTYVYLEKMLQLQKTHPNVYNHFIGGYHVVRRSDRYWGGLSTDLAIEQMLMRSLKAVGGMTRGRGMSEIQRAQWILSRPACTEVNYQMQKLMGLKYTTSEQHLECGTSRKQKDRADVSKMISFLSDRNPFTHDESLHSIASGVVANDKVNAEKARIIGQEIIKGMQGKNIEEFSFRRKAQVVIMNDNATVKVDGDGMYIDPQLLFQRMIAAAQGAVPVNDLEEFFSHELCTYPPALFESVHLMREASKSVLGQEITKSFDKDVIGPEKKDTVYVIDGGSLIQKLAWPRGRTYNEIAEMYVKYVTGNYKVSHVVFDGYSAGPTTKDTTHRRRTGGRVGAEVRVEGDLLMNCKKQAFLLNKKNKQNFINLLAGKLQDAGVKVTHAVSDADYPIVHTAVNYASSQNTVVLGEDTDLLILLCYHAYDTGYTLHIQSDGRKVKSVNVHTIQKHLGAEMCKHLLFIHSILGCDTTSKPSGIGKPTALKCFRKNPEFRYCAEEFDKLPENTSRENIIIAGEKAMLALYNSNMSSLNELRVKLFLDKTANSVSHIDPKTLPPTASATQFHSLRTYYQILEWKGISADPLDYGWQLSNGELMPKLTDKPPAPSNILKVVRCACKTGCKNMSCSCRKLGLPCTMVCRNCDVTCFNQLVTDEHDAE